MCNDLQKSSSGRLVEYKNSWEKIYTLFELIEKKWCDNCRERYHCRLLELLEDDVCL